MTTQDRLERAIKDVMAIIETVNLAAHGAIDLDAKVGHYRVKKELETCRFALTKQVFAVEDAERDAENAQRCPKCYSAVSKDIIDD